MHCPHKRAGVILRVRPSAVTVRNPTTKQLSDPRACAASPTSYSHLSQLLPPTTVAYSQYSSALSKDPSSIYIRLLEREHHQDACEESNNHYQEAFGRGARSCLLPRYVAAYTIHNRLDAAFGYSDSHSQALADFCPIDMVKEAIISVSPLSPAHHDRLAPVMSVAVTRLSPQLSVSIPRSLRGSSLFWKSN